MYIVKPDWAPVQLRDDWQSEINTEIWTEIQKQIFTKRLIYWNILTITRRDSQGDLQRIPQDSSTDHWRIQRGRGHQGCMPPRDQNSFIFIKFLTKHLENNRLVHPLWELEENQENLGSATANWWGQKIWNPEAPLFVCVHAEWCTWQCGVLVSMLTFRQTVQLQMILFAVYPTLNTEYKTKWVDQVQKKHNLLLVSSVLLKSLICVPHDLTQILSLHWRAPISLRQTNLMIPSHGCSIVTQIFFSLPPANEICEGYVFTGVCLSTRGGLLLLPGVSARGSGQRPRWADTPWRTPPRRHPLADPHG